MRTTATTSATPKQTKQTTRKANSTGVVVMVVSVPQQSFICLGVSRNERSRERMMIMMTMYTKLTEQAGPDHPKNCGFRSHYFFLLFEHYGQTRKQQNFLFLPFQPLLQLKLLLSVTISIQSIANCLWDLAQASRHISTFSDPFFTFLQQQLFHRVLE